MKNILADIPGVLCYMDDILVTGESKREHDIRLEKVLKTLENEGVTLNDKCEIRKTKISFLGHIISSGTIQADPKHIKAISSLPRPTDIASLRRFLGMINHVGKFIENLANRVQPLRELLKKDKDFTWGVSQEESFQDVVKALQKTPNLVPFNLKRKTVISADSSSFGLGAVLLQEHQGVLRAVAYASKSLSATQQKYAQIEKEAYAIVWACERFRNFVTGIKFQIQTDHKPLIPLFSNKSLDELPLRVQRFRMRLMRYSYDIVWVPGKNISTADTLSRSPTGAIEDEDIDKLSEEAEAYVRSVISFIPASRNKLEEIKKCQRDELHELCQVVRHGWPKSKDQLNNFCREYWQNQGEITINEDMIMRNNQILIPPTLRKEMLNIIHQGHQGITRCKERAKMSVWWPRINHDIEQKVTYCPECIAERKLPNHPMIPTEIPDRPWQKIALDLCEWKKEYFIVTMDYYSKFIDVTKITNITTNEIIQSLKTTFEKHGIPEVIRSDSGTQFMSEPWKNFKKTYGFETETSSPYHHQANGQAESGVKIVKNILKKCGDRHLGLLAYNTTPKESGYSPSQLLMGRILRTPLPVKSSSLNPILPNHHEYKLHQKIVKGIQEGHYNRRHRVTQEKYLHPNMKVWISDRRENGTISKNGNHRKFEVQTNKGRYIRNSRFLFPMFDRDQSTTQSLVTNRGNNSNVLHCPSDTRRSSRVTKPPRRLIEEI